MYIWYNTLLRLRSSTSDSLNIIRSPFDDYKKRWANASSWEELFFDEHPQLLEPYQGALLNGQTDVVDMYQAQAQVWAREQPDFKTSFSTFPFRTTLNVFMSAITKLSSVAPIQKVYRGTSGGVYPVAFWQPNRQNVRGGIDPAFMSTSTDRSFAMNFARTDDKDKASVLFEMQPTMISGGGASLQWCSQFPKEAEVLWPPLTAVEVVGTPMVEQGVIVFEAQLHTQSKRTVEDIISTLAKVPFQLIDLARHDFRLQFGLVPEKRFDHLDFKYRRLLNDDHNYFNSGKNHRGVAAAVQKCSTETLCDILRQTQMSSKTKNTAVKLLLDRDDAQTLQTGICLFSSGGATGTL
jgi:hypothetical protein